MRVPTGQHVSLMSKSGMCLWTHFGESVKSSEELIESGNQFSRSQLPCQLGEAHNVSEQYAVIIFKNQLWSREMVSASWEKLVPAWTQDKAADWIACAAV